MRRRPATLRNPGLWMIWWLVPLAACSTWGPDGFEAQSPVLESRSHTAGEELAQKKVEMRRARNDLVSMQQTLRTLRRHRSENELLVFEPFVRRYLRQRVEPLVDGEQASWHPDLAPLDANLRLAEAGVLIELGDRWRVQRLLDDMERRFRGMESLLVETPEGEKRTLGQGLEELRGQRWRI